LQPGHGSKRSAEARIFQQRLQSLRHVFQAGGFHVKKRNYLLDVCRLPQVRRQDLQRELSQLVFPAPVVDPRLPHWDLGMVGDDLPYRQWAIANNRAATRR
jgi:hypothetical protein